MATPKARRKRTHGEIEELPSGSLRGRIYAGNDPVSGKRHCLTETVPAASVRRPPPREPVRVCSVSSTNDAAPARGQLSASYPTTRRGYLTYIDGHIRPVLGTVQVARLDAETLDSFYASLRKCRARCAVTAVRLSVGSVPVDEALAGGDDGAVVLERGVGLLGELADVQQLGLHR